MLFGKLSAIILLFLANNVIHVESNRVLELNDNFLGNLHKNPGSRWLVMFYSPWCHPCKQFEPDYMQVAQILHNYDIGINVARIDCNKYPSIGSHFGVSSYPVFKYITVNKVVEYVSDRDRDEIIDFARRMVG